MTNFSNLNITFPKKLTITQTKGKHEMDMSHIETYCNLTVFSFNKRRETETEYMIRSTNRKNSGPLNICLKQ